MNFLLTAVVSLAFTATTIFGVYNYLPLSALEALKSQETRLGSTLTTILGSDTISSSRAVINANFAALNADKIENSTTTVNAITSLPNLATVGTITSGTWSGTAIAVAKGGTGTTTPSTYQVILGNGSNGLTVASSTGTSGQFLTSNGAGAYPSWQSATVDQTANYTWTGTHSFSATTTMATSTIVHLGVGTTSPSTLAKLAVGGDVYITGGLGIGTATTSDNNLVVQGVASTTNLVVSGTCTNCFKVTGGTSTFTGSVNDQTNTITLGFTPSIITAHVSIIGDTATWKGNGSWTTSGGNKGLYNSGSTQTLTTNFAEDFSSTGNKPTIIVQNVTSTGFAFFMDSNSGTYAHQGATIYYTAIGY